MTTNEEIDIGVTVLIDFLRFFAKLNPELKLALPFIELAIKWEAGKLKTGIADGSIVSDGAGGFVPKTNSRVMPDGTLRDYDPKIDG